MGEGFDPLLPVYMQRLDEVNTCYIFTFNSLRSALTVHPLCYAKANIFKESLKLNWNFQSGGGSNQKTFRGRGMDIF